MLPFGSKKNIITRTAFKERPPKVEYQLTKEGNHLNILINDMSEYGKKFISAVFVLDENISEL